MSAYTHIETAIKEMAYDNGCINRLCTEEELVKRVTSDLIEVTSESDLGETETFLSWLTSEQLGDFLCGEDAARNALLDAFGPLKREQAEIANRVIESAFHLL